VVNRSRYDAALESALHGFFLLALLLGAFTGIAVDRWVLR
jgi:hypothetical protein